MLHAPRAPHPSASAPASPLSRRALRPAGAPEPRAMSLEGPVGAGKTTLIRSVLAAVSARGLRAVYIPEPVEEWERVGALQRFYVGCQARADGRAETPEEAEERRAHAAYEFQTYTFTTRVEASLGAYEADAAADLYITERTVLTDRHVFMELQRDLVGPQLMEMYERWWGLYDRLMPFDLGRALYLYLRPSVGACMARVARRARGGEVAEEGAARAAEPDDKGAGGVSAAYQQRLLAAHDAFLIGEPGARSEFPEMPEPPFDRARSVLVVGGGLADGDFSEAGEHRDAVVGAVLAKMAAHWPELAPALLGAPKDALAPTPRLTAQPAAV